LGLAADEDVLVVFALSVVEEKVLVVCHFQAVFVPVLLIHQVLIKMVKFLAFLDDLVDSHVLQLENVDFLDHGHRNIDQRPEKKVIQVFS
jgi:hypothetical protein